MLYRKDGSSCLIMDSGYHHYIDTGLCTSKRESKNFYINGATVRLIRFGTSLPQTVTTKLHNVTITVDSGELWYLNTGYEIDEFSGALTVVFNNGTYSKFLNDYSTNKIVPRNGKYFIISPKYKGMKIIATDTPGLFTVSGNMDAYCISKDGKSAYYSVCSMLKLPEGRYDINYAKNFDISLLPEAYEDHMWFDNGNGVMTLIKKQSAPCFYVSSYANKKGNGSIESPFDTLEKAVSALNNKNGIIRIIDDAVYDINTNYEGMITLEGEDKNSHLLFQKNRHYYLRGDLSLKNLKLVLPVGSDKFMLETNGHALLYKDNVRCSSGMHSGLSMCVEPSKNIKINNVFVYKRNIPESVSVKSHCLIFCEEGNGDIIFGNSEVNIAKGNVMIVPKSTEYLLRFPPTNIPKPRLLVVDFTPKNSIFGNTPKLIELTAETFYGDIIMPAFNKTSDIINDRRWLAQLSNAIDQITEINDSKHNLPRRLREYVMQNYASINTVAQIADEFHLNRSYLERTYKKVYGIGLKKELSKRKCEGAKVLMKKGYSIKEAANAVGYDNISTFSTVFKNTMGNTPRQIAYSVTH